MVYVYTCCTGGGLVMVDCGDDIPDDPFSSASNAIGGISCAARAPIFDEIIQYVCDQSKNHCVLNNKNENVST